VPVIIGKNGIEKILEIDLSSEEKEQFNLSIKAVQDLYKAAKNIDKDL
jgi:malate dehydrogenase